MAGLLELLDDAPARPEQQSAFSQGLRAGVPGAKASFNQFAGGVNEAKAAAPLAESLGMRDGYDAASKEQYARAEAQAAESAKLAQGIPTWEDVKGADGFENTLRSAYDFGTGTLGRSLPAMAPSLAAGAAMALATRGKSLAAPAMAGMIGSLPFAAGDQIGELRADPQGQQMTPGERLGVGVGSGLVQGALDQVVPLAVGAKVIGKTASQAAGKGLAALTGRGLRDVALEGVTEGAQDAVAQGTTMAVNPDKQFDYGRLEANVAGGVAAGVPMAAPGVAGELVHGNVQSAVDGVKGLAGKAGDAISGAVGAAKTAVEGAGAKIDPDGSKAASVKSTVDDIPNQLRELVKTAKDEGGDFIDRVANSEEFMNAKAFVGATGERLKSLIDQDNAQRFETVKGWAQEMADKTLSPEQQDTLRQAMTDLTDRGNQAKVAAMKKASEAFETAKAHVEKFAKDVGAHPAMRALADGPKKSADYSGIRRAIIEDVAPILMEDRPEIFNDQDLVDKFGGALNKIIDDAHANKPISSDALTSLMDVAGDKTIAVLEATHKAVGTNSAQDDEDFYRVLNEIRTFQETNGSVMSTMRKSLKPEYAKANKGVLRRAEEVLTKWAETKSDNGSMGPSKSAYLDTTVRSELSELFGDKADAVIAAVEKNRIKQQNSIESMRAKKDDEGNVLEEGDRPPEERAPETRLVLSGARRKIKEGDAQPAPKAGEKAPYTGDLLYLHPDHDQRDDGFPPAATSAMRRLQNKNPGATVRFVGAEELGYDHPAVKEMVDQLTKEAMVESRGEMTEAEARKQAEKEVANYGMAGAEVSTAETHLSSDELNKLRLNATKFPKSPARIDTVDAQGEPLILDAVKMVREMNRKIAEGGFGGSLETLTGRLRVARMFMESVAAIQSTTGAVFDIPSSTVLAHHDGKVLTWGEVKSLDIRSDRDRADDKDTALLTKLRKEFADAKKTYTEKNERAKAQDKIREKAREASNRQEFAKTRDAISGDRPDVEELRMSGSQERDPFGNVHDALDGKDEVKGAEIRTDLSGLPRGQGGRSDQFDTNPNYKPAEKRRTSAGTKSLRDELSGVTPSPKAVAAKKAALLEKARSGDQGLLKALSTSDDAKGLQRAAAALNESAVGHPGVAKALETINDRLRELVGNPDVAYGLQTKKYSLMGVGALSAFDMRFGRTAHPSSELHRLEGALKRKQADVAHQLSLVDHKRAKGGDTSMLQEVLDDYRADVAKIEDDLAIAQKAVDAMSGRKYSLLSTQIHEDLGRPGFAATHDSPHRHEGKFNWREHQLKGEGAAAFGAGTYLSTAENVHKYYKKMFSGGVTNNERLQEALAHARSYPDATAAEIREGAEESLKESMDGYDDGQREEFYEALRDLKKMSDRQLLGIASPTYHVSVDAELDKLLDWDKPLSEQSKYVKDALAEDSLYKMMAGDRHGGGAAPGGMFYSYLSKRLGSQEKASDYLQSLGIPGHTYAAAAGKNTTAPNYVIYDDSRITTNYVHHSMQSAVPGSQGPIDRAATLDYIKRVLGDSVRVAWADLKHAGEFATEGDEDVPLEDIIRLSVHALNPTSVAYHEALHALFAKLGRTGQGEIMDVLNKAASAPGVMDQLREHLKNEPAALAQLGDPEERAAYMYQFWAAKKLKIGEKANNIFERIKAFIRSVLGTWSNDERALHILDYFHSGEFAKNMHDPDAVHSALMEVHQNRGLQTLKSMTSSLREMGEALGVAGGQRLRDTGIPALRQLADVMKAAGTDATNDAGYLPAARAERSRMMNKLGADLKTYSEEHIKEALEAMQRGVKPVSMQARIVRTIVNRHLASTLQYMKDAKVKISALGMDDASYFPRVWDTSYISSHQTQFLNMLEKYKQSGEMKGDPRALMNTFMTSEGAEFSVEIDKPGMQFAKQRVLSFISHEDAAPFMRKNLYEIMNSYTTQAARRAEWSRRLGDNSSRLDMLMVQAANQGATPKQLDAAKAYVRAVDGTLGDTINPTERRLFGNIIVYQNIRLLPLAIFSSVVDPVGVMVRGGTVADAFKTFRRGVTETVKNFKKTTTDDEMTRLAATLGTIDDATLVHTLGASYSQGMVGDTARRINDKFFRYNLMEQFNTSMRVGATEAALGFLARHADGTASPHSKRWLAELGLTSADVQLDADGRPKLTEADGLSPEAAGKMKMAVNRWVDGAVLRPDAADKPIWMSDPHWVLISHLKQFVFSFHETIIKRVMHEASAGNYTPAMALVSYVPVMIAADMMKGLIQGGGDEPSWKKNWTAGDYVWSGIERGGLLGTGQFAADAISDIRQGGTGIGALTGPTVEQITDAVRVAGGRGEFAPFAVKSMPANALYASALKSDPTDPKFAD